MPKVSVIIPVYNTEQYLEECLHSIINQTLTDIEIFVINDGSTDGSLAIIESFARADTRISVFSQENKGQSIARNVGIEKARGQFIYFMDSDDVLAENALQVCYDYAAKERLDFVFFNANILYEPSSAPLSFDYQRAYIDDTKTYLGFEILDYLITKNSYTCSPCLHFIDSRIINLYNLRFYPGIIHEDELFAALLYFRAEHVGYINESFFKRRVRPGSTVTASFSIRNVKGYLTVLAGIQNFCRDKNTEIREVGNRLIELIVNPVCYNASSLQFSYRLQLIAHCKKKGYFRFIRPKNLLVLLFPGLIAIKGFFKKVMSAKGR